MKDILKAQYFSQYLIESNIFDRTIRSDLLVSKVASVACDQMQAETRGSGDW